MPGARLTMLTSRQYVMSEGYLELWVPFVQLVFQIAEWARPVAIIGVAGIWAIVFCLVAIIWDKKHDRSGKRL